MQSEQCWNHNPQCTIISSPLKMKPWTTWHGNSHFFGFLESYLLFISSFSWRLSFSPVIAVAHECHDQPWLQETEMSQIEVTVHICSTLFFLHQQNMKTMVDLKGPKCVGLEDTERRTRWWVCLHIGSQYTHVILPYSMYCTDSYWSLCFVEML